MVEQLQGRLRAVISFTGGKDCHLALCRTLEREETHVVGLVAFHPPGEPNFKAHPLSIQKLQAEALDLPLWLCEVDASKHDGSYIHAYGSALRELREEHNVDLIVTGDIELIGSNTTNFISDVCKETDCGVQSYLPLWNIEREEALEEMLHRGFDIRFCCVKSPHFDSTWIGRQLDEAAQAEMKKKNVLGLDLCGENGEYHSLIIDGPMYKAKRLVPILPVTVEELNNQAGQKKEERWWVHKDAAYRLESKE